MVAVSVEPEEFSLVDFDAGRIADVVGPLVDRCGLTAERVVVRVDETNPLGRAELVSTDPLTVEVESGAFEDPKRPRQLSTDAVADTVGRVLLQHRDRGDPDFGAPPVDEDVELAHRVAWAIYAAARLDRMGYRAQRQRRLYHFRNRCGFTDAADAAFERLWNEELTWPEITSLVDEARAAREPAA
ncbi:MAG: hypothetical protein U5R31_17410 [Acidimicrobiia bacterium]|nr:hypothetical protein [Acidimicrobiia bacterium]